MGMINRFNPTPGALDFWNEFRKPTPYRWPILGVSALMTFTLMYQFTSESVLVPPAPPQVTYIASFPADRTDAEIIASNIENQRNQDAVAALLEQNEERKRELYRALGRASGMDVEAIEREAEQDRAALEAEENARKAEIRRRAGLPEEGISESALKARAAGEENNPETGSTGASIATPAQ